MNYFILLLFIPFLALISCKESEKPLTMADDKVILEYKKDIVALEEDKKTLIEKNTNIQKRIEDMAPNPKFSDLLRKQKFSNERLLILIDQANSFIQLKILERQQYLNQNISHLKLADLESQYNDLLIDRKTNPPNYAWRKKSATIAGTKNQKTTTEAPKKEEGGHGGGHGSEQPAPPAAEKNGGHGGGH